MPTQASQRTPKTYKIKITPDRVLGPLDLERVQQLVMKGRIQGQEPTAAAPFANWAPFATFPELSELLLKKLEADSTRRQGSTRQTEALPATKTIVSTEQTKTMAKESTKNTPADDDDFGMPTLLDIKIPEKKVEENPDLEKTMVHLPALLDSRELEDGATKVLSLENVEQALVPYSPPEKALATLTGGGGVPADCPAPSEIVTTAMRYLLCGYRRT